MKKLFAVLTILCAQSLVHAQTSNNKATTSHQGLLPPKPTADISSTQQAALEKELTDVALAFQVVKKHDRAADAAIFIKAVRYAIEFHEWYDKKPEDSLKKARALLAAAMSRIEALKKNQTPWMNGSGHKVLGFYSKIDDSPQPYGVEIPNGLERGAGKKPVPMWIWLHGRGDTATDIHFIDGQMKGKSCPFNPQGAIVVQPFGRYCNGWKSAGETDVLECKADATSRFNVDVNRIALAGFSMGGAGAWHLGAHYADQWAVVHTGAGFVDVKRYQKLTPEKYPPWYEQKLWGVYDVPDYARNFLNVPLICYSGEIDAQRDSAEYMMEVLGKEGLHPPHLIGPGMGHKYHPETLKEVQRLIEAAVAKGRDPMPKEVHLQTRSSRYGKMFWVNLIALKSAWEDARIDARIDDEAEKIIVKTKNVAIFDLFSGPGYEKPQGYKVVINGQTTEGNGWGYEFESLEDGKPAVWQAANRATAGGLKSFGFDGPADVAYQDKFIVVLPDAPCANPAVDQWVKTESAHFIKRWRGLMRGDPVVKKTSQLTEDELGGLKGTLCLWGDPTGNPVIATRVNRTPLEWSKKNISIAGKTFSAATHVPVMAYSDHVRPIHAIEFVLNSGLTFREAHDKTNSLQNPKLPDWAILDITQPPNDESAGKVVAADFFNERWQVKPNMPPVDSK